MITKIELTDMLDKFISQRSGIDGREYGGSREAFMGDYNTILRDGRDARLLLQFVKWHDTITVEDIIKAMRAFSGRLQLTEEGGVYRLDYCTGQYFPTEYRASVCAVLSLCLWDYWRSRGHDREGIIKSAKQWFKRGLVSRWFN